MLMASDSIPDRMTISLTGKNALYKNDLMMLEMLAQCNWTRPIYVALTVGQENYMNLGDNFVQEGLANRITPFRTNVPGAKNFDTEKTYHNVMTRFKFGGLSTPGLYIDETTMRMCYTHRRLMAQLALQLIAEHKNDKALKVLTKAEKEIPSYNVPLNYMGGSLDMARAYALIGQKDKAKAMLQQLFTGSVQYLRWYLSLNTDRFLQSQNECMTHFWIIQHLIEVSEMVDHNMAVQQTKMLNTLFTRYRSLGGQSLE